MIVKRFDHFDNNQQWNDSLDKQINVWLNQEENDKAKVIDIKFITKKENDWSDTEVAFVMYN